MPRSINEFLRSSVGTVHTPSRVGRSTFFVSSCYSYLNRDQLCLDKIRIYQDYNNFQSFLVMFQENRHFANFFYRSIKQLFYPRLWMRDWLSPVTSTLPTLLENIQLCCLLRVGLSGNSRDFPISLVELRARAVHRSVLFRPLPLSFCFFC